MDEISSYEYHREVHSIAMEAATEGADEKLSSDTVMERIWESVDSHSYVIYTFHAQRILCLSENDGYTVENFGAETAVKDGCLDWSALAFGALYADVCEAYWSIDTLEDGRDFDPSNPDETLSECSDCDGTGKDPYGDDDEDCDECDGEGKV